MAATSRQGIPLLAANLLLMFGHTPSRRYLMAVFVALCLTSAAAGRPSLSPQLPSAPEWLRLASLWQTMLDHSSNAIYSPTRFRELAKDVDAIDVDLTSLVKRGLVSKPISEELAHLFHVRYSYLLEHHYTEESNITVTDLEAAVLTSRWVVELQLTTARRAAQTPGADPGTIPGAEDVMVRELSFLREYEEFQDQAEKRRQALADRQAAGENVDFRPFERERITRGMHLLDAYRSRKIPTSRAVREVMPYLISLTTLTGPGIPSQPATGG